MLLITTSIFINVEASSGEEDSVEHCGQPSTAKRSSEKSVGRSPREQRWESLRHGAWKANSLISISHTVGYCLQHFFFKKKWGGKCCHTGFSLLSNMSINFKADGLKKREWVGRRGGPLICCALQSAQLQMEVAAEDGDLSKRGSTYLRHSPSALLLEAWAAVRHRGRGAVLKADNARNTQLQSEALSCKAFIDLCIRGSLLGDFWGEGWNV